MTPGARRAFWWASAVGVVLLGSSLRVGIDGRNELTQAEAQLADEHFDFAIIHYGRAARWRLPIATHDERALEGLEELARAGVEGGDSTQSLLAYREIRRSLLATRTPWGVSDPDLLERANAQIASLMAGADDPEREDRLAIQLAEPKDAPNSGTWLASLMFVAWLGALYGFFSQGLDERARLRGRPARLWGLAVMFTLLGWMLLTRHPEWIAGTA